MEVSSKNPFHYEKFVSRRGDSNSTIWCGTVEGPDRYGSVRKNTSIKSDCKWQRKLFALKKIRIRRKGGRYVRGLQLRPRGPGGWWTYVFFINLSAV